MDIESEEAPEALTLALDSLRQYIGDGDSSVLDGDAILAKAVCSEVLVRASTAPKSLTALKDAASVMLAAGADDRSMQVFNIVCLCVVK